MSYSKNTILIGHKAGYVEPNAEAGTDERYAQIVSNRPFVFVSHLRGHWRPEAALKLARRARCVGAVDVTYSTTDNSGHGRGGYDCAFTVTEGMTCNRPLTDFETEYDDAADVHDAWNVVGA